MSGNFTHLKYDQAAFKEQIKRSTDPLIYKLDPNYNTNYNKCFSANYPRNGNDVPDIIGKKIDVDSILRGYNKINTKSNEQEKLPPLSMFKTEIVNDCPSNIETEYTRHTNPSFDRSLNVHDLRLEYPLHDPQCQIFENFEINTRLEAKDNHKATWQIPLNQQHLFPVENLNKTKTCKTICTYAPYP